MRVRSAAAVRETAPLQRWCTTRLHVASRPCDQQAAGHAQLPARIRPDSAAPSRTPEWTAQCLTAPQFMCRGAAAAPATPFSRLLQHVSTRQDSPRVASTCAVSCCPASGRLAWAGTARSWAHIHRHGHGHLVRAHYATEARRTRRPHRDRILAVFRRQADGCRRCRVQLDVVTLLREAVAHQFGHFLQLRRRHPRSV